MTKRADPFYLSPAWRKLRAQAIKRDGHRCVVCGKDVSGKGAARVDHIKTRRERPDLALDLSNLRTLCSAHDNQGHREKGAGGGPRREAFVVRGCDADGWPLDPARG
ncbi:HNH endonuclease [Novispirillum sp. DQ9]|uniref:HNH endonuclease n=1 Tax=Novispirillum sp. DQ9 TaxID=3398612 RepID=UPI003C7E3AE1